MVELIGIAFALMVIGGSILGIIAFFLVLGGGKPSASRGDIVAIKRRLSRLEERLGPGEPPPEPTPEAETPAEPPPPESTPPAEPEPPEPAEKAEPAGKRLRRDWARIEKKAGQQWLTWVGVMALLVGLGFFVKYAFEQQWIGPTTRVALGILAGIGLVAGGHRALRRQLRPLGQGLIGGGLAVLYLSLFAAFSLYELLPQPAAFGAMVLVTAGGLKLALLHDALPISFLAVLGGLLTPVLLSTGEDARDALFGYLAVLNAGVLGVAVFKRWRALDVLAFIGTVALFGAWFVQFYEPPAMLPTLGWLAVFYVIFLLTPFARHMRRRTPIPLERFLLALANATFAFVIAYLVLRQDHQRVLGFIALIMSAAYLGMGAMTRRRIAGESRALFGFLGLAVVFLTLAVPVHLGLHGITLAWAAEGPVLIYLGYRYRYEPVRMAGFALLLLAGVWQFAAHWPLHAMLFRPFLNTTFGSVISVPVAAGVAALLHERHAGAGTARDRLCKLFAALGGGLLALVIVHAEVRSYLAFIDRDFVGLAAVTALWAAGSALYLLGGLRWRSPAARMAGLLPLAVAAALGVLLYSRGAPEPFAPVANVRFAAGLLVILAAFAYPFLLSGGRELQGRESTAVRVVFWAGVPGLLALLSAESYRYCIETITPERTARWVALMSVSVVWGLYATALLVVGFRRRFRALRLVGLGLFGATAVKLVLVDIAGVKQVYRIVAFVVLGLLMVGAAYLYGRAEGYILDLAGGREAS